MNFDEYWLPRGKQADKFLLRHQICKYAKQQKKKKMGILTEGLQLEAVIGLWCAQNQSEWE